MAKTLSEKARGFAIRAHGDQKYGKLPYSVHLDAVAELARPYGETCEVLAFLHDVLEDTDKTPPDIVQEFGNDIAVGSFYLTDPEGENRKVRKAKLHRRLAGLSLETKPKIARPVLIVKACDRLANLRECSKNNPGLYKMYTKEHAEFKAAVYRPGLCDEIWAEIDSFNLETAAMMLNRGKE